MLDSGGGGYAGSTNWSAYDVPAMWTMLERQETDKHWTHVSGWRKTADLTSMHLARLEEYRDKLAEAWPPTPGSASEAYVNRLNGLIDHVQKTYDVAVANYDAAAGAIGAMSMARQELRQVHDEYVVKAQQKRDYDQLVASESASQLPGTVLPSPPVTQTDLERLNAKARSIMYAVGGELVEAQVRLQQPPPNPPRLGRYQKAPEASARGQSPAIPPIVPVSPPASAAASVTVGGGVGMGEVLGSPSPTPGAGPVLGGVGTLPLPTIPVPPGVIAPTPPSAPAFSAGGFIPTVLAPPVSPGSGGSPRPRGSGAGLPGSTLPRGVGSIGRSTFGGMFRPRPMPPGGLIGAAPGAGLGQPGSAPVARKINPVGGLIGGGAPVNGGGSRAASSTPPRPPSGAAPLGGGPSRPASGASGSSARALKGEPAGRSLTRGVIGMDGGPRSRIGAPSVATQGGIGGSARPPLGTGGRGAVIGSAAFPAEHHGKAVTGWPQDRGDHEAARRWDPDRPWEIAEGVSPLIVPPPGHRVDPGPAIGLDR
jgi:hypothetical protein